MNTNSIKVNLGPNGNKKSTITIIPHSPVYDLNYETIERKGIGHPDSICDSLASELSKMYSNYTRKNCDELILHHQFDKVMLIGGHSKVYFGGGEFLSPIKIFIVGRVTKSYQNRLIPVDEIIEETISKFFTKLLPLINFKRDIEIHNFLTFAPSPGTITTSKGAIADHFMFSPKKISQVKGYAKYVSNDTSYCVSYTPLSKLERAVLKLEEFLNQVSTHKKYPWLGTDIKIMAVRNFNHVSLTMCIPQISFLVESLNMYQANLETIAELIQKKVAIWLSDYDVEIAINTKDDYKNFNIYLTIAGSSLSGEFGVVGRGNRTNGLITSNRPMSMEGTNGKNPRYYAGFVYAAFSKKLSQQIYEQFKKPNIVEIVSQNGGEILKPWQIRVVCVADQQKLYRFVEDELKKIPLITEDFLTGKLNLS